MARPSKKSSTPTDIHQYIALKHDDRLRSISKIKDKHLLEHILDIEKSATIFQRVRARIGRIIRHSTI